eukprot:SAG11_NODE_29906_length_306_cov_0.541063_1_plen_67_part_01
MPTHPPLASTSCLAVGGGVGYKVKVEGAAPALSAHPHYALWVEAAALVQDGLALTKARALELQARGG